VGRKAADRLSSCGESATKALPPILKANYRKQIAYKKLPKQLVAGNCKTISRMQLTAGNQ
jgi:hypothetical protein